MAATIKEKLKGAFDLVFLFGRGIEPFEKDNTKEAGLKSLWIVAILFPINLLSAWLWPPADLNGLPKSQVIITELCETAVSLPLGFLILWAAAIALNAKDRFWIVFQASNWVNIPFEIIPAPILLMALAGWHPHEMMDRVFTILTYYQFIVSACIIYRGLKTNWMLAACIATFGIAIGQFIQNCADWANGVPIR